ncbi:transcription initiation factor [Musa troglodytarum]|uniref:Transcription initiation factor n=1 Tax=Musa troglodytarum TaxID=320322 RepID=A0A9E7IBU1_9LILI|nr:transcription initiation factor [Musa troglodytarum]
MDGERGEERRPMDLRNWHHERRWRPYRADLHREVARLRAPGFARYRVEVRKDELDDPNWEAEADEEESTRPFSAAMATIKKRVESRKSNPAGDVLGWTPSSRQRLRRAPPLLHLCLMSLVKHGEEIESLEGIPDDLKHKIVSLLCSNRKMNSRILRTYLNGSTTEIHLTDCSWASEDVIQDAFTSCNINHLRLVQLDLSGRCMPDYVLQTVLDKSQYSFPSLVTLSLKGAYRLTDNVLSVLASSAPSLKSINLGKCSLITSCGIISLAEKLNLAELYIDNCQKIDVMQILPALETMEHLEVLSVAGASTVCDTFISRLMHACGYNMRELIVADCQKLTTKSVRAIGANCPNLCLLDLQRLNQLNDLALKYLANGCRSMTTLKLRQNLFSDEAIAAFLEASGGSLIELSLNSIAKVEHQTAIAVAYACHSNLQNLDLSFCRQLTDEALGFIVDNCSRLSILKLFGCSQVTEQFLEGHSNSQVRVIGLTGSILDEMEMSKGEETDKGDEM